MADTLPTSQTLPQETPFLVEHLQLDRTLSGSFRPAARLVLLPALRTSGLWAALPPEDFKNLMLLLTYLSPNGYCQPTVSDLAEAMQVSQAKARSRMLRLAQHEWRGRPVALELPRLEGTEAYVPGRQLFAEEQAAPPLLPAAAPVQRVAGQEAVMAHSRSLYSKTRAEVERDIAERMGWTPPAFDGEDPAVAEGKRQAFEQMSALGIAREQVLDVLSRFDLAHIERQLTWLPARHAKSPARFLLAAIEGDYEMPPALRRQALLEAATPREQDKLAGTAVPEKEVLPHDAQAGEAQGDKEEGSEEGPAQDAATIYRA